MAEPRAQVPVSPNWLPRMTPNEAAVRAAQEPRRDASASEGMKTSTTPITVPIQLSGQVTSRKARQAGRR